MSKSIKMTEEEKRIESIRDYGGRHLQNFKDKNITYSMCLTAVSLDGTALEMVPERFLTAEIYSAACKATGKMLRAIPKAFITEEICLAAVKSDGLALEFVPEQYIHERMCLAAACSDPKAFRLMPKEFITYDFCNTVLEETGYESINALPKEFKNEDFIFPLVETHPKLLWHLPKTCRTKKICESAIKALYGSTVNAIKADPKILSLLHTSLYDHDTCVAFIESEYFKSLVTGEKNGRSLCSVNYLGVLEAWPETYSFKHLLQWPDTVAMLMFFSSNILRFAKKKLITYEICMEIAKYDSDAFKYIPQRFLTREFYEEAFVNNKFSLEYMPEEYITLTQYRIAF